MNHSQPARARVIRFASRSGLAALLLAAAVALLLPSAALAAEDAGPPSEEQNVQPYWVDDNPTCPEGLFELKVDPPNSGEYTKGALTVNVDVSGDNKTFDWTSNLGIDLVIVKGGDNANFFDYEGELGHEVKSDTGLHSPVNPKNGQYYGLSHMTFCYDFELEVEKNAETTFTRDYEWQIEKSNEAEVPLKLSPGQYENVNYKVTASVKGSEDSNWAVSGEIKVFNPAPIAAEEVDVTDEIEGVGPVTVNCPSEEIPAESTLVCTYESNLPDGKERTNEATATTTTEGIGSGSGTAKITFGDPTSVVDGCIDVYDTFNGESPQLLGKVCVGEGEGGFKAPHTFEYSRTVGGYPDVCETYEVHNTASFTEETGPGGSAPSTVYIEVLCSEGGGCTLTQGYWKTHSEEGPAPYDDTWEAYEGGTAIFDSTGVSWYALFWTAPQKGNAYVILAHQYMAAVLNGLNGADTSAIEGALKDAYELLYESEYTLEDPPKKHSDREEWLELASMLAAYNEGYIGPGHCSEGDYSQE